jgi:SAM-dependent methyltransferase
MWTLLLLLCASEPVAATPWSESPARSISTRSTPVPALLDGVDRANLVAARLRQVELLRSSLLGVEAAMARALYRCVNPHAARAATGYFNQALKPTSALRLAAYIGQLGVSRVLWVGCGCGCEAILLALVSRRPLKIVAIDHLSSCVEEARLLLLRVLVAVTGMSWDEAAALDVDQPMPLKESTILFLLQDAWLMAHSLADA